MYFLCIRACNVRCVLEKVKGKSREIGALAMCTTAIQWFMVEYEVPIVWDV